jgi:hypothetical protein
MTNPEFTIEELSVEEWRPCPGFEEYYSVSNLGRVRREKAAAGTRVGRIKSLYLDSNGYPIVILWCDCTGHTKLIHRLVAMAFLPQSEKPRVNHIDGIKANNRACNLEWCTDLENMRHAVENGLIARGDRNGSRLHPERMARGDRHGSRLHPESVLRGDRNGKAKLTEAQVLEIRQPGATGILQRQIAVRFGISRGTVGYILHRKTWNHV